MVRLLGKMFCIFAELEFFRNGELFYGMLTLLLPFAPAYLSSFVNHESFKEVVMHLPFLQLRTHLDRIKWIMRLQNQISEFEEELEQDPGRGALINDYTELQLHFCLNNNYTFSQIFRVLNNNYTNLNRVE